VFDAAGNLYGTSRTGGTFQHGTIFQLSQTSGVWTGKVIYSFSGNNRDEGDPEGPVILDSLGNVYGTTGGNSLKGISGNVFELTPNLGGWQFRTVHLFGSDGDGAFPLSGLTPNRTGTLYGTTFRGGANDTGAVYQLARGNSRTWVESVIFSFPAAGGNPYAGVTIGQGGIVFVPAAFGGSASSGEIYQITP
jgi:uncharacterized repeat protein (TIGR03803 family)